MLLEIRNINKSFNNVHVLKNVSFSATTNNTLGLLGRNGHGKSTTMRIIVGILSSDSGEILIDGTKLSSSKFKIGYLPEERGLYQKITVLEQMIYFAKLKGMNSSDAKKEALNLLNKLEISEHAKKKSSILSKGNQQKVQLAIALLNNPDIIILDEPFSGLDPVNGKILKDLIEENAKLSKIILFSSHQLGSVEEFCQDICIINGGESILNGNLQEIKDQYTKDKLLLVPERNKQEILKNIISNNAQIRPFVLKCESEKRGLVVTLTNPSAKNILIHALTCESVKAPVTSYSVLEPTLLEIFLEKVGVVNEQD